jgi:N-methylhydantoinase A/oxoprolinase/acetone carboxylase beta subunit
VTREKQNAEPITRTVSVGIDIGGTFSDVVAYDFDRQRLFSTKVPSTPPRLFEGFMRGLEKVLDAAGAEPGQIDRLIHGTTIATNAVLERKGARIGILATDGFEDVLVIGRQRRSEMYDLFIDPETPIFLAPRRRIKGIPERIGPEGEVIRPLDVDAVRSAVREMVERHQVEAIAVCYLFSFRNDDHERRTLEIIHEEYPELPVSLSSVLDPKFREYERLCVTAFDAYVRPVIASYVAELQVRLQQLDRGISLEIMQSRGGITGAETVVEKTVATILSGPAAGVIGGRYVGERAGVSDLITIDIGGTSSDAALIRHGKPLIGSEGKIGSYPLRQPMIDVNTIGAGGGSIAWIDAGGGLRVGPQSAGSNPGPACYDWGGREPTVTDASAALGYLNPNYFAGGELRLSLDLAQEAIERRIAGPLGLSLPVAAAGIHRIINARMADQLRLVSVRRGHDPRRFALVPLGGAGPLHAGRLAEELGIANVIIPPSPGVLSAFGLLVADIEHEHSLTFAQAADHVDLVAMRDAFERLDEVCREKMQRDRVPLDQVAIRHSCEMHYVGQSYELEVPLASLDLSDATITRLLDGFHRVHEEVYGHCNRSNQVEIVNLRSVHTHTLKRPELTHEPAASATLDDALTARRPVYFDEFRDYIDTPVYRRERLPLDQLINGPAIIEQADTTTIVYPRWQARADAIGNVRLTRFERETPQPV